MSPTLIPEEGLDHPLLATLAEGELLSVMLTFAARLDAISEAAIARAIEAVIDDAPWDQLGGEVEHALESNHRSMHIALTKRGRFFRKVRPGDLRPLIRQLLAAVDRTGPPLAETMLARLRLPGKGGHFLQPIDDPRDRGVHDLDDEAAWRASFDPAAAPPASEPEGGLFMLFPNGSAMKPERRNTRLWLRDLRIIYGLPEVEYRPLDDRAGEVATALTAALGRAFRGDPPAFLDREARPDRLDAMIHDGRPGYGFAVQGMNDRMLVHYPSSARFREYELMLATRDAATAAGLCPVLHWYRERGLYVLNLWEPQAS